MRFARSAAAFCAIALGLGAIDYPAEGKRWWAHIQYLASDALEGRDTGSEGYRKAAAYVADHFKKYGLKPAGTEGYYQPVRFLVDQIVDEKTTAELVRPDGTAEPLRMGDDVVVGLNPDSATDLEAPLMFIGYGMVVPEKGYSDIAGLDLKGKIVVSISGIPEDMPGPLAAHYQSFGERWAPLRAAGAIGMIRIFNPHQLDLPWARIALSRFNPQMTLADPALWPTHDLKFSAALNPASAGRLFIDPGHNFDEVVKWSDAGAEMPHYDLPFRLRVHVERKQREIESPNVAGILPGSDPKLKNEYVVMSAHLDHVGVGKPIDGDSIYNGAMDNASGVASILEIARLLHENKARLRRSLLFVGVTAEEKGDLGSDFYASRPTVPARAMIADFNLDMFLPLYPLHDLMTIGLNESTLGDTVKNLAPSEGIEIMDDPMPERNLFIRSDQYSFVKQGVPALMFGFGAKPGSPEEKIQEAWIQKRYHAPSDDVNQPVDLAAAAKFNDVIMHLLTTVANNDTRPEWKQTSFFARFAKTR
ncbi:MAG TPA: M28 family metallopeptidase [Bryobacteraceae bacterium]|nr:M28 family metallopeptidase [Bryobacteraceae bacterium]